MPVYSLGDRQPHIEDAQACWIAPGAHVVGDVFLGRDTSIWFGAVLRGDNEPIRIGDGSNVQENAVIHTDPGRPATVGRNCTIGHGAIVHGCTLGDQVLIGMGATVLNGAVIGDNCLVGANALVTEGKVFPPGSLIMGAPAKAVRALTPEAIEGLLSSAQRYQSNARRFRESLREV